MISRSSLLPVKIAGATVLVFSIGAHDPMPYGRAVIGYADDIAAVLAVMWLAWLVTPIDRRPSGAAALVRATMLDLLAWVLARPALRLTIGRWPDAAECETFRRAFRRFDVNPPLMRALSAVPAARDPLTRAMLTTWLRGDPVMRDRLRQPLDATACPTDRPGDCLSVWLGPPVAFLHLEKTGGMTLGAFLTSHFHPLQIAPDVQRGLRGQWPVESLQRFPLVWGHHDLPTLERLGPERFIFTVLRDPRSRILSLYDYWRSQSCRTRGSVGENRAAVLAQTMSLLDFLRSSDPAIREHIDNFYVRRMVGELDPARRIADQGGERLMVQARGSLDRLEFIGLTERMDDTVAVLAAMFGLQRPTAIARVNATPRSLWASGRLVRARVGHRLGHGMMDDPVAAAELDRLTEFDRFLYFDAVSRFDHSVRMCPIQTGIHPRWGAKD